MMKFAILILLAVSVAHVSGSPGQPPANPDASPAVRAVLKFIQDLPVRTAQRLLSGQFTEFGTNARVNAKKVIDRIQQRTGYYPAILGVDYADWHDGSIAAAEPNAAALDQWQHGGLVTINVHFFQPAPHQSQHQRSTRPGRGHYAAA